ncbi:uncharacterized protein BO97DRAFT_411203 [Aspergillus homomorphus CBS 101889]|uniref:Uncharacterized protein n=1 Tax=Aspergillus homomorphus (strain CBS 101889) TaxID=1450537 RepID=A0A395I743_ASPHC|nr:hypothetical protein BO97DRAFT_411203 [Aspergillus homomorphus CBS 101889]RAL15917.1 hypothetical protein BO97DRAFT_411203 [Aspergillus homomorphus CBS 101889]
MSGPPQIVNLLQALFPDDQGYVVHFIEDEYEDGSSEGAATVSYDGECFMIVLVGNSDHPDDVLVSELVKPRFELMRAAARHGWDHVGCVCIDNKVKAWKHARNAGDNDPATRMVVELPVTRMVVENQETFDLGRPIQRTLFAALCALMKSMVTSGANGI